MPMEPGKTTTPRVGWTVTGQQETNEIGATGRPVRGFRVMFQVKTGPAGSVFVPTATYNRTKVAQAIAPMAAELAAVHNLSG